MERSVGQCRARQQKTRVDEGKDTDPAVNWCGSKFSLIVSGFLVDSSSDTLRLSLKTALGVLGFGAPREVKHPGFMPNRGAFLSHATVDALSIASKRTRTPSKLL